MLPATKNGVPVQTTAQIPINWKLTQPPPSHPPTLDECMAIPAVLPLEQLQAGNTNGGNPGSTTIVRIFVSAVGSVDGAKVDRSSGSPRVDEAAVKQAKALSMNPATLYGQGVESCVTLPVRPKIDPL
jgi:TonB family protein